MEYDKNQELVDEICSQLPNREFPENDPNPLHQVFRSKKILEYYFQKVHMGEFTKSNQYAQGFISQVHKNDKSKNAVELMLHSGANAAPKLPSTDDLIKEKLQVISSALPVVERALKAFKKTKACIMASKNPTGALITTYKYMVLF